MNKQIVETTRKRLDELFIAQAMVTEYEPITRAEFRHLIAQVLTLSEQMLETEVE